MQHSSVEEDTYVGNADGYPVPYIPQTEDEGRRAYITVPSSPAVADTLPQDSPQIIHDNSIAYDTSYLPKTNVDESFHDVDPENGESDSPPPSLPSRRLTYHDFDGVFQFQFWWYGLVPNTFFRGVLEFPMWVLRAVGNVVFLDNPISGLVIVTAVIWENWWLALCGLLCTICATLFSVLAGVDINVIRHGLMGLNAFLVGEGIAYFLLNQTVYTVFVVCFGGVFCVIVQLCLMSLIKRANLTIPVYTFPFNITMICFLLAAQQYPYTPVDTSILSAKLPSMAEPMEIGDYSIDLKQLLEATVIGVGQVFFVGSLGPSLLLLCSALFCSRVLFFTLYIGSCVGVLVCLMFGINHANMYSGLFGYNPALTLSCVVFFYYPSFYIIPFGILCAIGSSILTSTLGQVCGVFGIPSGTLGFCFMSLIALLQYDNKHLQRVPGDLLETPEAHFRVVRAANYNLPKNN